MSPPPHLALGCISREVVELLSIEARRLDIDAIDILLLACTAYLSTADALAEPMSIPEYEYGHKPLPLSYCRGIMVKEIACTLNMSRETVRRRLQVLAENGFLLKKGRFYFLPYQGGDTDFTANARTLASRAVMRIHKTFDLWAKS
jgi:hypothetical protein